MFHQLILKKAVVILTPFKPYSTTKKGLAFYDNCLNLKEKWCCCYEFNFSLQSFAKETREATIFILYKSHWVFLILIPRLILTRFLYIKKLRFVKPSSNKVKIIRFSEKNFKKFQSSKIFTT